MANINNISNNEYVLILNKNQEVSLTLIDKILKKVFEDFFLGDYQTKTFNNELKTFIYLFGYDLIYSEDKKFIGLIDKILKENGLTTTVFKIDELNEIQNKKIALFEKFLNHESLNNEKEFDVEKYFIILDLAIDILLTRLIAEIEYGTVLFDEDIKDEVIEFSKLFNFNQILLNQAKTHIKHNIDENQYHEVEDNFLNFESDYIALVKSIENDVANFYEFFICFENYFWIGQTLTNLFLLENENQKSFIFVNDLIKKYQIVNKINQYNNLLTSVLNKNTHDIEGIDFIKDMEIENFDNELLNSIDAAVNNNFELWNNFKDHK